MQVQRDIRDEQVRAGISQAWKIWNDGKVRLDKVRDQFNLAVTHTQHFKGDK